MKTFFCGLRHIAVTPFRLFACATAPGLEAPTREQHDMDGMMFVNS